MTVHHTPIDGEELPGSEPDPKAGPTIGWGVAGIVITLVLVLILEVGYYETVESEQQRKQRGDTPVDELREAQLHDLSYDTYVEVEGERQLDTVPVEHAMELIVKDSAER